MTASGFNMTYIFDFDGTIVDSMEEFADIAAMVMPKYYPVGTKKARRLYMETSGIPFFEQLHQLFPKNPANDAAASEFERIKLESYYDKKAFDDVPETMAFLKSKGIRTVVSSNNFQGLVDTLVARLGIEFDLVLGFRPGFAKGRDHFAFIERKFAAHRDSMVFVGDSLKDGERAKGFGIRFIGKAGIFTESEFLSAFPGIAVIRNLSELRGMETGR
jgi:phosphoglycolate phosphatase